MSYNNDVELIDYNGHQITINLFQEPDGNWVAVAKLDRVSISSRSLLTSEREQAREFALDLATKMIDMQD